MNTERLEILMVRVVDGLASPAERAELDSALEARPELRRELETHMAIKMTTDQWVRRLDLDLAEDALRTNPTIRWVNRIGMTFAAAGFAILTGYGLVAVLLDPEAPLWIRAGMGLFGGGSALLMGSAIVHRFRTWKSDAYKEVIR